MASDEPRGFSLDIDQILKDVTGTRKRTTRRRSTSSTDMDSAVRRAVRAELGEVEKSLRLIADEVVRLRKANEALAAEVARLAKR
jgi:predicted  nucleic acid-binding Zn-ribbon protein